MRMDGKRLIIGRAREALEFTEPIQLQSLGDEDIGSPIPKERRLVPLEKFWGKVWVSEVGEVMASKYNQYLGGNTIKGSSTPKGFSMAASIDSFFDAAGERFGDKKDYFEEGYELLVPYRVKDASMKDDISHILGVELGDIGSFLVHSSLGAAEWFSSSKDERKSLETPIIYLTSELMMEAFVARELRLELPGLRFETSFVGGFEADEDITPLSLIKELFSIKVRVESDTIAENDSFVIGDALGSRTSKHEELLLRLIDNKVSSKITEGRAYLSAIREAEWILLALEDEDSLLSLFLSELE